MRATGATLGGGGWRGYRQNNLSEGCKRMRPHRGDLSALMGSEGYLALVGMRGLYQDVDPTGATMRNME